MKVIEFKPKTLDRDTIRALKSLLEGAINGDVSDVCYVAKVKHQWVYKCSAKENNPDRLSMIGMLEAVKQRVLIMIDWGKL